MRTIKVRKSRMQEWENKAERLNRIAAKLGVEPLSWEVVGEHLHRPAPKRVIVYNLVAVEGESPKVPGFRFVGTIEPSEVEGVNFVTGEPGLSRFATAPIECEHCNTRRRRNAVYLIESEDTGKVFRVGRSCLKDFTGHDSPERIAALCDAYLGLVDGDSDWMEEGSGYTPPAWDLVEFVAQLAAVIDEYGWAPSDAPDSSRTLTVDALELAGPFRPGRRESIEPPEITPDHRERAEAAIKWARSIRVETDSDYLRNLRLAVAPEYVTWKRSGLVASIFRAMGAVKARETAQVERAEAAPLPVRDDRWRVVGTILTAQWREHQFGASLKILVKHADGWKVWGTAPKSIGRNEESLIGKSVAFDARVTASDDDPKFGFFSRPTKAEIL